ncbi:MAG: hypothetical protein IKI97_09515 [Clostridia bacterium]|nr:hypothetical protein [Clostridia bacterium]
MGINNLGTALSLMLAEIKSGTFPGTVLIEGKDEGSRMEAARLCAAALVCESEDKPCGECNSCKKVLSGRHPDVTVVVSGDEKVSVGDIRKIRLDAVISPFEAECKVIILDKAQTLNVQSQNALLKILEEPPKGVYFILTSPSSKLLLATVDSRCAKFSLGAVSMEDVYHSVSEFSKDASKEENLRLSNTALYLDGFIPSEKSVAMLKIALEVCTEFYSGGKFPFEKLPAKKDDSELLKIILKVLSLSALEVLKAKKGILPDDAGILGKESLLSATGRIPLKTAFYQYGFFCELYERLEENANLGAVIATLRAGIYD